MPETIQEKILFIAAILLIPAFIGLRCHLGSDYNRRAKTEKQTHWESYHARRAGLRHQKEENKKRLQEDLEKALGGEEGRLLKSPDISIKKMLLGIAELHAPPESSVFVEVDNFSEFDVEISVKKKLSRLEATKTVKNILTRCNEYVNSISFRYQGNIVKMIQRDAIEKVKNWERVDPDTVANLMITP